MAPPDLWESFPHLWDLVVPTSWHYLSVRHPRTLEYTRWPPTQLSQLGLTCVLIKEVHRPLLALKWLDG